MKNKKLVFSLALGLILIVGAGALALNTSSFQGRFTTIRPGVKITPVLCGHKSLSPVASTVSSVVSSSVVTGSTTVPSTVFGTLPGTITSTFHPTPTASVLATLPATVISTLLPSGTVSSVPSTVSSSVVSCVPYSIHEGNLPDPTKIKNKWWQKVR